jgi:hypothetical protein
VIPSFQIRFATEADVSEMSIVERESWGDGATDSDTLAERIRVFPKSTPTLRDISGRIVAFATALRISAYDFSTPSPSWNEITGRGRFAGVHDPKGQALYGVNLSARRALTAAGAARAAVEAIIGLVCDLRCQILVLGGRMPLYHTFRQHFDADDYIRLRRQDGRIFFLDADAGAVRDGGKACVLLSTPRRIQPREWPEVDRRTAFRVIRKAEPLDPQIAFHLSCRCAGVPLEMIRAMPEYFEDASSCNYGVLYRWTNPFTIL